MDDNIKYLPDGQQVRLLQKLEDEYGYLVEPLYYDESEETEIYAGEPIVVPVVFDQTPTTKYDTRITELSEEIERLEIRKKEIRRSIDSMEFELRKAQTKFSKVDALKHLLDFIDGKLTHYAVLSSWKPEILAIEETKSNNKYDSGDLRLLSLFGRAGRGLHYKLFEYTDGSGSSETVVPCTSYEEAEQEIKTFIKNSFSQNPNIYLFDAAVKYDIALELDQGKVSKIFEEEKKRILSNIKSHEREVEINQENYKNLLEKESANISAK